MDSILLTIKKGIGIDPSYEAFDPDIIMHINSVLFILTQEGIGPKEGFNITGQDETWEDFLGESNTKLSAVQSYVTLKTRLLFDPPQSGALNEQITKLISELEWRLYSTNPY